MTIDQTPIEIANRVVVDVTISRLETSLHKLDLSNDAGIKHVGFPTIRFEFFMALCDYWEERVKLTYEE